MSNFYKWLREKLKWQALMLTILALVTTGASLYESSKSSTTSTKYRYAGLPSACVCEKCGYVLENPTKHCPEIPCPRCGGRMWRRK